MTPDAAAPGQPGLARAAAPGGLGATNMTRGDRIRDSLAVLLVVLGAVFVIVAHTGDARLATQPVVVAKGQSAFAQWMHYYYYEMAGYAAIIVGVVTGVVSYAVRARRLRRSGASRTAGA
jgi:hypothetical protein